MDANSNGVLDTAEVNVSLTKYVCNGAVGATGAQGPIGLTGPIGATGAQGIQGVSGPTGPTGSQGPIGLTGATGATGAQGIQGVQGPTGASGTNGADGKNTLVKTTNEAAGANCPTGGTKVEVGLDANSNGFLDTAEVIASSTKYVCNGAVGATGAQGPIGLTGPTGATGPQGVQGIQGIQGSTGLTGPQGVQGVQGAAGANGVDGKNTLIKTTTEAAGANCANGGTKIEVGLDSNSNGVLDSNEIISNLTKYVCDGSSPNTINNIKTLIYTTNGF